MDGIPVASLLDGVGVVGIIVLVGLGFASGRLYTKRQYDDVIHDRDEWRAEGRLKDQLITELVEQNNILLRDIAPAMTAYMAALERAGERGSQ